MIIIAAYFAGVLSFKNTISNTYNSMFKISKELIQYEN